MFQCLQLHFHSNDNESLTKNENKILTNDGGKESDKHNRCALDSKVCKLFGNRFLVITLNRKRWTNSRMNFILRTSYYELHTGDFNEVTSY